MATFHERILNIHTQKNLMTLVVVGIRSCVLKSRKGGWVELEEKRLNFVAVKVAHFLARFIFSDSCVQFLGTAHHQSL